MKRKVTFYLSFLALLSPIALSLFCQKKKSIEEKQGLENPDVIDSNSDACKQDPFCKKLSPDLPITFTYQCDGLRANCPSASDAFGNKAAESYDAVAYACVDWSAGSKLWAVQQEKYEKRTGNKAIFGVGSWGNQMENLGKCYKVLLDSEHNPNLTSTPIIVQAIDTGSDVSEGQFDMQVMAGGVGICNALTNTKNSGGYKAPYAPLFSGDLTPWGDDYGGFDNRINCDKLPIFPHEQYSNEKNIPDLCKAAYEIGVRLDSGDNPKLKEVCRVKCPAELYMVTGLRQKDDDQLQDVSECINDFPESSGILTRMFDGCKPSAAWRDNVSKNVDPKWPVVIPCGPDGVTRVDMQAAQKPPGSVPGCYFVDKDGTIGDNCGDWCNESQEQCEQCGQCEWFE